MLSLRHEMLYAKTYCQQRPHLGRVLVFIAARWLLVLQPHYICGACLLALSAYNLQEPGQRVWDNP